VVGSLPTEPIGAIPTDTVGFPSNGGSSLAGNERVWFSGSYSLSWIRPIPLPTPLVTTGMTAALGAVDTGILFGNTIDFESFSGFQVTAGLFLDDDRRFSIEGRGQVLFPVSIRFAAASDAAGNPTIARPVFNAAARTETAFVDSLPGVATGSILVDAKSELYGFEVNGRCHLGQGGRVQGHLLAGFRHLRLTERLTIQDQFSPLIPGLFSFGGPFIAPGQTVTDIDSFATTNEFYGGNIGAQIEFAENWYSITLFGKLGIGCTEQRAAISGSSTLITPGAADLTLPGGILAAGPNLGQRKRNVFALVPEWGLSLGANVTPGMRVMAGYSFLMWSKVNRPGDVLDRGVNPSFIPTDRAFGVGGGPDRPAFRFTDHDTNFWMHTFNAGVELLF
jgi:hypothetical protein